MEQVNKESDNQSRVNAELKNLCDILARAGYTLNEHQPHTIGERFLMQNITTPSGQKVILLGTDINQNRVVIKATSDPTGKKEIQHEQACRSLLHTINFAYDTFTTPEEITTWTEDGYLISVQQFIDQESSFIERPLEEQFEYALRAFKTQESARATTASHYKTIASTFGIRQSEDYLRLSQSFLETQQDLETDQGIQNTCQETFKLLERNKDRIEQYCGFLTHTDFVPHNFRIKNGNMYLLDTSSLEFGNKHESWARFLNFMTLYNYKLEKALIEYIEHNRAPEERESMQLMRLYRLVEIITYYSNTLKKSADDLLSLNKARVEFWHDVLQAELRNERVRRDIVESYRITRDRLRSQDEKERQKNLH